MHSFLSLIVNPRLIVDKTLSSAVDRAVSIAMSATVCAHTSDEYGVTTLKNLSISSFVI